MKRAGYTFSARYAHKIAPYAGAIRAAGMEPVALTPEADASLETVDALIVCGGTDIDPGLYGQTRHPEADEPDRPRDEMELRLLRGAIERDMPVLCICRGLQMLNVARGGTLHQHIDGHRTPGQHEAHTVRVTPGTLLATVLEGAHAQLAVNSRHHQAVDRTGQGLLVTAHDSSGEVIEGMELTGSRFVLAVQWHPEDRIALPDNKDILLFRALAAHA